MNKIIEGFSNWAQPQLLSLIVTVLIITIMSIVVFFKVDKVKADTAPTGVAYIAEAYVGMVDRQFDEAVGEQKLQKARVYILTLGTFLLVGNGVSILGLEPIVTSYSIPLTLALASWLGILASGLIYQKIGYIKKFWNPLEVIGKIPPLISLGFRIYGNVIGGSVVIFIIYSIFANLGTPLPNAHGASGWVLLGPIITPVLHFYFDIFGSTLQAYVFSLLTIVYWYVETGSEEEKSKKKKKHYGKQKRIKGLKKQLETIY
ncbi:F0F1 ATP synthase subunit A [Mycoplasma buteonis]|uniref:F0F1 ATP synthase subunit A n=1 Tax=Mycoplasma buteonis TaxID=171280 RepID=UPI000561C03D|nr:F0F1 ATP synthase subunit A [Mycoplasma buteonis]